MDDFTAVYKEAGIALPPHGYGVDRVAEMLGGQAPGYPGREVRATAVLAALEAARVDVQDVIEDGVRRDKALDAFEAAKERELVERKRHNETRVQSLRKDLDELLRKINTEIEKLKQESADAEKAFAAAPGPQAAGGAAAVRRRSRTSSRARTPSARGPDRPRPLPRLPLLSGPDSTR